MPDFSELFEKANWEPINFNGKVVIQLDKFPIKNGDKLIISIEKTNSENLQGVSIDITGSCEMNGKLWKQGKGINMILWENATLFDTKHVEMTIYTKEDFVWVQNIWENTSHTGQKSTDYGRFGAAMIVEEIENGRRYHCNDWHPDENFDDIVFTIQRLKQ